MSELNNNFDMPQIIKKVYEQPNVPDVENPNLLRVRNLGGTLVPEIFDKVFTTYVVGGAANNEVDTLSFYLNNNLIATLMFEYYPNGLFKQAYKM